MKLDAQGKVDGGDGAQDDSNVDVIQNVSDKISTQGKLDGCVGGQGDSNSDAI